MPADLDDAACRGLDVELFFSYETERGSVERQHRAQAIQVCSGCPVRRECLDYAMRTEPTDLRYGIWGGLTGPERRTLARRIRRHRVAA
jgi:WhiB family redox-sensing transcriptional regulator